MRMLSCLLLIALPAFPALADEAVPGAGAPAAQVAAPQADAQPATQDAQPRKKRALACPACATNEMPSFAIRPADSNGQAGTTAGAPPTTTHVQGSAASEPPVNFSFAASGNSYSNKNRYRGGVYMAAPF